VTPSERIKARSRQLAEERILPYDNSEFARRAVHYCALDAIVEYIDELEARVAKLEAERGSR
jgi:3-deoxy-D-manno-octulosonic-acid transferase